MAVRFRGLAGLLRRTRTRRGYDEIDDTILKHRFLSRVSNRIDDEFDPVMRAVPKETQEEKIQRIVRTKLNRYDRRKWGAAYR